MTDTNEETVPNTLVRRAPRPYFFAPAPSVALLMYACTLTALVMTDLIVYRTCLVSMNVNQTTCLLLRTNTSSEAAKTLESKIEPYASMIIMAKSLIESILPAILSMFLGPWSDRGGRRPLFLAGFTGFTLMYVALSLMSNWNINPWYLVIPSIPASMSGGFCAILLATVCHVSDTTTEKDRTMLLAWLQASILGGIVLATFTGPLIYKQWGFTVVFTTSAICCILALVYSYFCIPETVPNSDKVSLRSIFDLSYAKDLVSSIIVQRDGFHRSVIWLTMSIITLNIMTIEGEVSIAYLFTRARLGWDVQHFSWVAGVGILINIVGVLVGVSLLSGVLGLPDTLLAGMSILSSLGAALTRSLTTEAWHMYLAPFIGIFSAVLGPVCRSIITKSVPAHDIGKVFSLTSSLETLSPLAGAPLFTLIYSHYLPPIYPSPVYLVSASFYALMVLLILSTEVFIRRARYSQTANYSTLIQEID